MKRAIIPLFLLGALSTAFQNVNAKERTGKGKTVREQTGKLTSPAVTVSEFAAVQSYFASGSITSADLAKLQPGIKLRKAIELSSGFTIDQLSELSNGASIKWQHETPVSGGLMNISGTSELTVIESITIQTNEGEITCVGYQISDKFTAETKSQHWNYENVRLVALAKNDLEHVILNIALVTSTNGALKSEYLQLDEVPAKKNLSIATLDRVLLSCSPNPAHSIVTVKLNLAASGSGGVDIINLVGQTVVKGSISQQFKAGETMVKLNTPGLPAGNYMVRAIIDGQSYTQQITIQ